MELTARSFDRRSAPQAALALAAALALVALVGALGLWKGETGTGRGASGPDAATASLSPLAPFARPGAAAAVRASAGARGRVERAYGKLPLRFEANRGQTDSRVRFAARGAGYSLFLTRREAVLSLSAPARGTPTGARGPGGKDRSAVVRMGLVGASAGGEPTGVGRLAGRTNYLTGGGRPTTGVPGFSKVRYRDVYPGVDLLYYGTQGRLEYDFELASGADPSQIELKLKGADGLRVSAGGELVIGTAAGAVRFKRPVLYQRVAGRRRAVSGGYVLEGHRHVGFRVGAYDRARPLVIDPVLSYATYLGGAKLDGGEDIAVDSSGSAYVLGSTASTDFPTTDGALDRTCGSDGSCDPSKSEMFVSKLNPSGSALVYSTYLGGSGFDFPGGIAVDGAGSAYVTGSTASSDFRVTAATAFQPAAARAGGRDAFVSKLVPDGSALAYSTYLGGGESQPGRSDDGDRGTAITVDSTGAAYVTGAAESSSFPTRNAFQAQKGESSDVFVAKLDTTKSGADSLVYSTYLGGNSGEAGSGIAVSGGEAYVGGTTGPDFPTKNAFQPTPGGNSDGFVTKLDPGKSGADSVVYSTYLGGAGEDYVSDVAVEAGRAYLTGTTSAQNFPTTAGVYQPAKEGGPAFSDAFVTKLGVSGGLDYSTYLGGADDERGADIAVDAAGAAYVAGHTGSKDFPVEEAIQTTRRGPFVTKLAPGGATLAYSTHFGATDTADTGAGALALDSAGAAYLTGGTPSAELPTTAGALQPTIGGGGSGTCGPNGTSACGDAFIAKLAPGSGAPFPEIAELAPTGGPVAGGTAVTITGTDLGGVSAVSFGGAPAASFTQDSASQVTAVTPARAQGLVDVRVTTARGGSSLHTDTKFFFGQSAWQRTGTLAVRRYKHTATLLANGKVLVAGGGDSQREDRAELYDPRTAKWTPTGPLNFARTEHTATLLTAAACKAPAPPEWCGEVLVVGGSGITGTPYPLTQAELYDPSSGRWSVIAGPQTARAGQSATLLPDGKVLVAGGCGSLEDCRGPATALQSAEIYDPVTKSWTPTTAPVYPRTRHTATTLANGKVLLAGGYAIATNAFNGTQLVPSEVYDPQSALWTPTRERDDQSTRRLRHQATLLKDGRVLMTGGQITIFSASRNSAELYDPAADEWKSASPLNQARDAHSATLLPSGKVLVAGGSFSPIQLNGVPLSAAETYDPSATGAAIGAWTPIDPMLFPRLQLTATLLSSDPTGFASDPALCGENCGKVLVVGGFSDAAELYTPPGIPPPPDPPPPGPPPPDTPPPGTSPPGASPPGVSPPGVSPPGIVADRTAPRVSRYGLTATRFAVGSASTPTSGRAAAKKAKQGTTLRYTLSEPATARIVISQRAAGRLRGKRCIAPTRSLRKAKMCTRTLAAGTLTRTSRQGANSVAFSGRIASRALKPGRYQATLTATDKAKNTSKPKTITFTVVKR